LASARLGRIGRQVDCDQVLKLVPEIPKLLDQAIRSDRQDATCTLFDKVNGPGPGAVDYDIARR
jgi:hypothetical protein